MAKVSGIRVYEVGGGTRSGIKQCWALKSSPFPSCSPVCESLLQRCGGVAEGWSGEGSVVLRNMLSAECPANLRAAVALGLGFDRAISYSCWLLVGVKENSCCLLVSGPRGKGL